MSITNADFVLTEKLGVNTGPAVIREALYAQRSRFIATLRSFGPSEWAAPSRCSLWSVHDVVRHLADAAEFNIGRLIRGSLDRFTRYGPFDSRTTPAKWLADTAGQEPQETLEVLARRSDEEYTGFARRIEGNDQTLIPGVTGRPNHWSVRSLHTYWDAWLHERDIAIPFGVDTRSSDDELRLMAAYALQLATAFGGEHLRASLSLRGGPDVAYHINGDPDDISVAAGTSRPPDVVEGDLGAVLDSLAGRGPEPAAVLTGPADIVEQLARQRSLMLPQQGESLGQGAARVEPSTM
ncbi:maleylpyruvate isomerase family mycothiol-dependent enzyme [Pseudonocardia sp. CA-142604]|uniref:maleylpyruvate isomerase family mycothiol-dependent enzyme n=1 Tax=Pseudonocardia sp. CA-142604 TaxID=3240024 RepID=UPI003D8F6AB6